MNETPGINRHGYAITTASVALGLALQIIARGIWGFFLMAVVIMIGVFLPYS